MGLTTSARVWLRVRVFVCVFSQPAANKAVFTASPKSEQLDCERMSQRMKGRRGGGHLSRGGVEEEEDATSFWKSNLLLCCWESLICYANSG